MRLVVFIFFTLLSWQSAEGQIVCSVQSFDGEIATGSNRIGYIESRDGYSVKIDSDNNYTIIDTSGKILLTGISEYIRRTIDFTLVKQTESGLWGILRKDLSVLLDFEYEDIFYEPYWPGFKCIVRRNQKWGIVDSIGTILLPIEFDELRLINTNVAFLMKGEGKYLYFFKNDAIINLEGTCVRSYESRKNERAVVFLNQRDTIVGAYNLNGEVIFESKNVDAKVLDLRDKGKGKGGFCFIVENSKGKLGLLDNKGRPASDVSFEKISKLKSNMIFGHDIAVLEKYDRRYLYSNGTLTDGVFDSHFFGKDKESSCLVFSRLTKYGVYDFKNHEYIIEPIYDKVTFFDTIGYSVEKDGKHGVLTNTGGILLDIVYDKRLSYVRKSNNFPINGYMVVKDGLLGYLDADLRVLLEPKYHEIRAYQEDMARVMKDYKWGFIDTSFYEAVEVKYDYVYPFEGGKSKAVYNGREIYIDKLGNCIENCD